MTIDADACWRALLAATGHGPQPLDPVREADGTWRADAAIQPDARELLESLSPVARPGSRFVVGQIGQSLDGRICTESGDSYYVNGDEALTHLHRLRALVDCVLVGVGTVVADRPRLTVRRVDGPDPVRAVLDPSGRAPLDVSPLAPGEDEPGTLHLVGPDAHATLPPAAPHVRRVQVPVSARGVEPSAVLEALAGAGCGRVLVEGGATTLSRFVAAGCVDRLHVLVAPLLIGSGRAGLSLPPVERLADALRPPVRRFELGRDTLFDVDLRAGR
ncbi:MAG: RibD family protein [Candidatus Wenzhouxiangella sp. M2_3B_020]